MLCLAFRGNIIYNGEPEVISGIDAWGLILLDHWEEIVLLSEKLASCGIEFKMPMDFKR